MPFFAAEASDLFLTEEHVAQGLEVVVDEVAIGELVDDVEVPWELLQGLQRSAECMTDSDFVFLSQ